MAVKPKTLTQVRGQTLLGSQKKMLFFYNWFSHLVFTQVKTDSLVFSQGIIHGDTLGRSDWMPE
jgi:hypothetical protein